MTLSKTDQHGLLQNFRILENLGCLLMNSFTSLKKWLRHHVEVPSHQTPQCRVTCFSQSRKAWEFVSPWAPQLQRMTPERINSIYCHFSNKQTQTPSPVQSFLRLKKRFLTPVCYLARLAQTTGQNFVEFFVPLHCCNRRMSSKLSYAGKCMSTLSWNIPFKNGCFPQLPMSWWIYVLKKAPLLCSQLQQSHLEARKVGEFQTAPI